jgi:propionate CoA-transferase
MEKRMKPVEAARLIQTGDTVLITGSGGGLMDADYVYAGVEDRFQSTGQPSDLTLVHATGIGTRGHTGLSRFAHEGLVRRVIGGHWAWSPEMIELAQTNKIEAYNLPQGILSLLPREIAAGRSGLRTHVGLNTFVDPRQSGGKLNDRTTEDLVELVTVTGVEKLHYRSFPVDVTIIRGTTADERGNISVEQEAANLDILSAAQAAYNSGGRVIAQVKQIARKQTLHPRMVQVPAALVDAVVVDENQWQTVETRYNPSFSGEIRAPMDAISPLDFDLRKIIARRAALELRPDTIVNLGFGIADGVANVAAEEGWIESITFSIEQGIVGGVPAKGDIFGAGYNPGAIIDATQQFDFYHGGGLDTSFLGMAQIDRTGNVTVSKFGNQLPGCGGFINISQNTPEVMFCGTFTAGGLETRIADAQLTIEQEGTVEKFVSEVEQITFSGANARKQNQRVLYVTERAVFQLTDDGLEITEIAPGIDLEEDVLVRMAFTPAVRSPLPLMDERIFCREALKDSGFKPFDRDT